MPMAATGRSRSHPALLCLESGFTSRPRCGLRVETRRQPLAEGRRRSGSSHIMKGRDHVFRSGDVARAEPDAGRIRRQQFSDHLRHRTAMSIGRRPSRSTKPTVHSIELVTIWAVG